MDDCLLCTCSHCRWLDFHIHANDWTCPVDRLPGIVRSRSWTRPAAGLSRSSNGSIEERRTYRRISDDVQSDFRRCCFHQCWQQCVWYEIGQWPSKYQRHWHWSSRQCRCNGLETHGSSQPAASSLEVVQCRVAGHVLFGHSAVMCDYSRRLDDGMEVGEAGEAASSRCKGLTCN